MSPAARPSASSASVRARMSRQASRDTGPEMVLRRELHRRGMRYRVHARPVPHLRITADVLFLRARVAVFVDGCFWHQCPEHATRPRANAEWWAAKLEATVARDRRADRDLADHAWTVVRIWEHTLFAATSDASDRVEAVVRRFSTLHLDRS